MRQPAGDEMTTETTGTSEASGASEVEEVKESVDPEFDPEATGVIPKITLPENPEPDPGTDSKAEKTEETDSDGTGSEHPGDPEDSGPTEPEAADSEAAEPETADSEAAEVTEPQAVQAAPEAEVDSPDEAGTDEAEGTVEGPESAASGEESSASDEDPESPGESTAPVENPESQASGESPESAASEQNDASAEAPAAGVSDDVDVEDTNPALRLPDFTAAKSPGEVATEITAAVRLPTPPKSSPGAAPRTQPPTETSQGAAESTVALRLPASGSVKIGHAPEPPAVPAGRPQAPPRGRETRLASLVRGAPRWLPVVLVLEGLLMYVLALRVSPGPLRGVDPADIGGLGLISAMPLSAFFAIVIMIVSFFVTVTQSTDRKFLLLFQIAAITFALHGAGAIVADEPRFPTAYVHAGFVDFISRTGETSPQLDARMAWPGFFALFAFVGKAAGITDFTTILNWTPLLSNLLYLLPFVLILRQVVATTRARWFAALLFILVQWIQQDYFSPQGFTFALYLAFVAILLRWFGEVEPRTKPMPPKGPVRRLLARLDAMLPGELANTGTFRADKLLMLLMLVALFFAATASHQITPFMMLGTLTAFLIVKRTSLTWALPFFFGLVLLAWISYQTVGFWQGNMESIFGGIGRLLENFTRGTGDRIDGSDPVHALVLQTRLGICATVLLLAAVGLFRRLRRGVFDRAALVLLCVPVLAMALQSYGGEMGLRVYMFMLPGACLLAAYAFFPNLPADSEDATEETVPFRQRNVRFDPRTTRMISIVLAACVALTLSMAFLIARYGNEKFERVTTGEVAAMRYVYEHDKPSARVLYLVPKIGPETTPILPWGEKDFEKVDFTQQALVHKDPADITDAVATLRASERNTFLAVTRGQAAYLQLNEGFPADWYDRFVAALDKSKEIRKVYANDDAALYTWKKFVKGTEIPDPRYTSGGPGDPSSPWDLIGVIALGVTWLALFAYEVIRLHGRDKAPRARRRLLWVGVPAFAVAIAVVVERFLYIGLNMFQ
ncbi:hypothetical protein [Nonomuraea africana]|uniref:Glycosyltransferase RgtA/B/C/D-like domain-containing protein n=1 Tax=Nonomuraea africana TaxID=46171 RepID=A0ABR9KL31_9ACTN|nr:hypothetical protein [Nonomuraea africana]MBE1562732.1 hypothetical protein [Nonomuraea africana]